jgi:coniferyl-aldehyde dehydrogenase
MTADIAYLQTLQQPLDELDRLFDGQRAAYAANPMPPAAQRQQWLKALRDLLSSERQALIDAISADFSHRSADETLLAELMPSLHGIHYASRHSRGWMKASRRKVGMAFQPAAAKVVTSRWAWLASSCRGITRCIWPSARWSAPGGGQPGDAQTQ